MKEIIKLKEKIERINVEMNPDSMNIEFFKGICRFEEWID